MTAKKILIALFVLTLYIMNSKTSDAFTISAQVNKSVTINLDKQTIMSFISNLDIYPKYFPNVQSVKRLNDKESEWLYKVEAALSSPWFLTFLLEDRSINKENILLESKEAGQNYLMSRSDFKPVSDNKTSVSIKFKIAITRDKASDIHFMAGILGEKFISARMQETLEEDLDNFLATVIDEMYSQNKK